MYTFPESTGDLDTALAVGLGNQLHVVHASERFLGRLLYNTLTVNAPALPAQQIQTPLPASVPALPQPTIPATAEAKPTPTCIGGRGRAGIDP